MKRASIAIIVLGLIVQMSVVGCNLTGEQNTEDAQTPAAPTAMATALSGEPRQGGVLIISYGGGSPRHLNPALVSGSSTAIPGTQIFASPLRYDENWNPRPYLAESWDISEDGLSVTLNLVEGATFHDGHPITSEDVAFSILTVKAHHPFKPMFAPVESVDTPDPHTAVIRLSRPHPAILLAMSPALLPIIPEHIYEDGQDITTHPANLSPVGSGPFKFVEYTPGESIVLERYDGYFIPNRPYLDGIIIRLETNPDAQMIEMERQEAHLLAVFTKLDNVDRLGKNEHLIATLRGYEGIGPINWLAFNLLREPLDDKRVRQAIAYAVDPEFITQYLHDGRSRRALGPISPDSPFHDPSIPAYTVDLAKANNLLDAAGYPIKPDGTRFSLTLDYIPVVPSQQRDVALYLKRQLAEIGIDVQVRRSASFLEWTERVGNWDFDMTMDLVYNWGDPVIGVHRTYLSDNIREGVVWSNTQNYDSARVDELLNMAEMELDESRRKALYSEFQQIVADELPIVWINLVPLHTVYHVGLGNPPLSIWGVHSPFDEVYWRNPPTHAYAPIPTLEDGAPLTKAIGVRSIALIQDIGFYEARKVLHDPAQEYLGLEESGLHVIGFTQEGTVFLDNSGQTKPGMDISGILDMEGNQLLSLFLKAAAGENDGYVTSTGVWPHPTTHETGEMSAWCSMLDEDNVICVLAWNR